MVDLGEASWISKANSQESDGKSLLILQTIVEIETVLNDRPLMYVSSDVSDV